MASVQTISLKDTYATESHVVKKKKTNGYYREITQKERDPR